MNALANKEEKVLPWMFYVFGYLEEQNVLAIKADDSNEDDDKELHLDEIEALCIEETTKFLSKEVAALNDTKTNKNLPFYTLRNPLERERFFKCQEKISERLKACWTAEDAKGYTEKEVEVCFPTSRVFYELGSLQSLSLISIANESVKSIETVCLKIADDWSNKVDIQDEEEEAYPAPYAQRVLLEKYGVKNK